MIFQGLIKKLFWLYPTKNPDASGTFEEPGAFPGPGGAGGKGITGCEKKGSCSKKN
jgi:hypothetical protein